MKALAHLTHGIVLLALLTLGSVSAVAEPLGSAITYQGRLLTGDSSADGSYDFRFALYASPAALIPVGGPVTNLATSVSNGLFTVALNFGAGAFGDSARWLEISVRTNGGGAFRTLLPRQPLTPSPSALYAPNAGLALIANGVSAGSITAQALAPGVLSHLDAPDGSPLNAVSVSSNGLVGIGTSTPEAGLHITATAPLLVGSALFQVADGMGLYTNLAWPTYLAASGNLVAIPATSDSAITLVNIANPSSPQIRAQIVDGQGSFTNIGHPWGVAWAGSNLVVAALWDNAVTIISATNPSSPVKLAELRDNVGGWNYLNSTRAVAVRGSLLAIAAESAVTLADISNPSSPQLRSTIVDGAGGFTNLGGAFSVVLSGNLLAVGASSDNAVTLVDVSNPATPILRASFRHGMGVYTNLDDVYSVALSGNLLAIAAWISDAVTLVDVSNPASPVKLAELKQGVGGYTTLDGAQSVALSGNLLAVAAGYSDAITLLDVSSPASPVVLATVHDGIGGATLLGSPQAVAFAGTNLVVSGYGDNSFTILGFSNQPVSLTTAGWVGIGTSQPRAPLHVAGDAVLEGDWLDANVMHFEVGIMAQAGGKESAAVGHGATANGDYATSLGMFTEASGLISTALGRGTVASGRASTAMGWGSTASGEYATAMGTNTLAGGLASVAMGAETEATGAYALAAGRRAHATHNGALVWADGNTNQLNSATNNSVTMRASGGYRLYSNSGGSVGVSVAAGGNSWSPTSDRNLKQNFRPVDARAILEKVAALPVTEWNLISQDPSIRHLGPMAQDFKAAFGLGEDDRHISTSDADGVALAAIQGLDQELEARTQESAARILKLEVENAELKKRLERLERLLAAGAGGGQ